MMFCAPNPSATPATPAPASRGRTSKFISFRDMSPAIVQIIAKSAFPHGFSRVPARFSSSNSFPPPPLSIIFTV